MKIDDEDDLRTQVREDSARILAQCKKDVTHAIRTARTEDGKRLTQQDRFVLLETFFVGYLRAVLEIAKISEIPLLHLLAEVACEASQSRNLSGMEEGIHQLLHKLQLAFPDGDLDQLDADMFQTAVLKVRRTDPTELTAPGKKKDDFNVN